MITLAALIVAAAIIFLAMFGSTYGYMKRLDENGESVKYYHVGTKPYNGFKCLNYHLYAFDEYGVAYIGPTELDGRNYYFYDEPDKAHYLLRSQKFVIDENEYYANSYGELVEYPRTGFYTAPDGYKYYYDEKGRKVTSRWLEIDGNTYYFQPVTGRMLVSEKAVIDGITYVFDENGLATQVTD